MEFLEIEEELKLWLSILKIYVILQNFQEFFKIR